MLPKENRDFLVVIAILVLVLTLGYFLLGDDGDHEVINQENKEPEELPKEAPEILYPPIQLLKPKEVKHSNATI